MAWDPPSVITQLICSVCELPSERIIFRNASWHSSVPILGVYLTIPLANGELESPNALRRDCIAGCIGNDTLPIARLITCTWSLSLRLEKVIWDWRIAEGFRFS